jgi:DNA-binding HxlR family transcriptional regulator
MVTRRSDQPRSGCAINAAVEVIGDRWSLLVLRDVMFGNRRHFHVLQERSAEAIASNILADRLRRLVADGLPTRAQAGRGRRAEYSLTEAAIQLVPVMAALGQWGARHRPTTPSLRVRAELLADGGPDLWDDFMAELRAEHLGTPLPPPPYPANDQQQAHPPATPEADFPHNTPS